MHCLKFFHYIKYHIFPIYTSSEFFWYWKFEYLNGFFFFFLWLMKWHRKASIRAHLCFKRHFESFYLQKNWIKQQIPCNIENFEFCHPKNINFFFWPCIEHMPFDFEQICQKVSHGFKGLHFGFGDRGHSLFTLEIQTISDLLFSSGFQEINVSTSFAGWMREFSKFDYAVNSLNISSITARHHKILMKSGFWLERLWTSTLVVEKQ